ncbi:MAG: TetR/AcrR family transcriptional regulator [Paracoccus sp. (in: a-proteobacteria)]|uniref:TetR/AcrR family transcriptional regulator n=1 Tax=Paracoccus sp. TaxID=267 RepID=UPI0026E06B6D|nr:TetR/AcrR family transcriptional regulator [Paracoccus sp. (in: a-proteobacteria)]MDO5613336.1 TetR/AcrR family transcriptional regulator [Paracoccus sp. (in: a-proteobacteria)]
MKNLTLPLSERLIEAGMQILLSGETLTLRGAAARAGVSHGAPAHHFDGLSGLRTAIAIKAFRDFGKFLRDALDQPVPDDSDAPRQRLRNLGRAYCQFAQDQGTLFHLMLVHTEVDRDNPDLASAMQYAYEPLRIAAAPFTKGRDPVMIETMIWSLAHGYAMLGCAERVNSLAPPFGAPALDDLMREMGILGSLRTEDPTAAGQ